MDEVQRHNCSFVVRIWWEGIGTGSEGQPVWRGWVQHVRDGRQLSFQTFEALLAFIEQETGVKAHPAPQQPPGGLV